MRAKFVFRSAGLFMLALFLGTGFLATVACAESSKEIKNILKQLKKIKAQQIDQDQRNQKLQIQLDQLSLQLNQINSLGTIGPQGPQGVAGQKGDKGDIGSLESLPGSLRYNVEIASLGEPSYNCVVLNTGEHCADIDGCRIRVLIQHQLQANDQVRNAEALIYMENPESSSANGPGLYGHTFGHNVEYNWILGTSQRYEIWSPWDLVTITNYRPANCPGQEGVAGPALVEDDRYKMVFMTPPNISARVLISDESL